MAKFHSKRRGIIAAKGITIPGGGMDLSRLTPRQAKQMAKTLAKKGTKHGKDSR